MDKSKRNGQKKFNFYCFGFELRNEIITALFIIKCIICILLGIVYETITKDFLFFVLFCYYFDFLIAVKMKFTAQIEGATSFRNIVRMQKTKISFNLFHILKSRSRPPFQECNNNNINTTTC